jgi:hypothetical protein
MKNLIIGLAIIFLAFTLVVLSIVFGWQLIVCMSLICIVYISIMIVFYALFSATNKSHK